MTTLLWRRIPQATLLVPKARGQVNKAVAPSAQTRDCLLPFIAEFGEMITG